MPLNTGLHGEPPSVSSADYSKTDTHYPWAVNPPTPSLAIGVAAAAIAFIVRSRRRAATRQHIEVGAVSEGWIAQHRGSRQA